MIQDKCLVSRLLYPNCSDFSPTRSVSDRVKEVAAKCFEFLRGAFTSVCFLVTGCAFRIFPTEMFSTAYLVWLKQQLAEQSCFSSFLANSPTLLGKVFAFLQDEIDFSDLFASLTEQDGFGHIPFHNSLLEKVFSLLGDKLSFEEVKTLLSVQDQYGKPPLHNCTILEKLLPLLEKLEFEQLKELLSIRNQRGNPSLFAYKTLEKLLPLLEKLEFEQLKEVLSIQDKNGNPPLHDYATLEDLLPLLKKLNAEQLKELLSVQDYYGSIPLNRYIIPFLEKLEFEQLKEVLSIQDKNGYTPLHYENTLKTILPVLEKLNAEQLKELLSVQNDYGSTSLHNYATLKDLLPLLKKLNGEQLKEVLSIQNHYGSTSLHNYATLKDLLPLLKKLNGEQLKEVLSVQNDYGSTPLHNYDTLEKLLPFLEKLNGEQLKEVLSVQNHYGSTPLHDYATLEDLLSFLEKLNGEQLKEVLSIQDKNGYTILHRENTLEALLPLLGKLNGEQLKEVLSIQDKNGYTPLHSSYILKKLFLPLFEKLEFEQFKEILSVQDKGGNTPLHSLYTLQELLPLFEELKLRQLKELLSIQDKDGKTLLHYENALKKLLPLLEKLEFEQFKEILSVEDKDGKTPLHRENTLQVLLPFLREKLNKKQYKEQFKEILSVQDKEGTSLFSFFFPILYPVSPYWVFEEVKYPESVFISQQEYRERAEQLKESVQEIFDHIPEEARQMPFYNGEDGTNYSFPQVQQALQEMLKRVGQTIPFTGTPPGIIYRDSEETRAEKQEALFKFYTPLLIGLEGIVVSMQESTPQKSVEILFDLAKVQLGGFCATRYKDEILQKANSLGIQGQEERDLADEAAIRTLEALVEKLASEEDRGNVHTHETLKYQVKLVRDQDLFINQGRYLALLEAIQVKMSAGLFHTFFTESLKAMPVEKLFDWFDRQEMEPSFGAEYELIARKTQELEEAILEEVQSILCRSFTEEQVQQALQFLSSPKGAALSLSAETNEQWLQNALQTRFGVVYSEEQAQKFFSQEEQTDALACLKEKLAPEKKDLLKWRRFIQDLEKRKDSFEKIRDLPFMQDASIEQLLAFLEQKARYDAYMRSLTGVLNRQLQDEHMFPELEDLLEAHPQLELAVNLTESGNASGAVRRNRRIAFSAQFFSQVEVEGNYKQELTEKGVLYIAGKTNLFSF